MVAWKINVNSINEDILLEETVGIEKSDTLHRTEYHNTSHYFVLKSFSTVFAPYGVLKSVEKQNYSD